MRVVDFYQLPRHVQERFVSASRGVGLPSVLLAYRPPLPFPWLWTVVGVLGFGVVVVTSVLGFGTLGHPQAILDPLGLLACAAGAMAALLGALQASAARSAPRRLHYPAAVYLYPVGVINAISARPRIHLLTELVELVGSQPPRTLRLRFADGASFEFDAQNQVRATEIEQQIRRYQAELPNAQQDPRELAVLDPLTDSGVPNPLLPTTPLTRGSPWWVRWAIPLALLGGAGLGLGAWFLRNLISERRMLAAAVQANTVEAYRAYLSAGGSKSAVSELWLPRAELLRARNQRSVEAIEQFVKEHPNSKIEGEATLAMREALLGKLTRTRDAGQVTGLRQIAKQHARYDLIETELENAIQATYQGAIARFRSRAVNNGEMNSFMRRLVDYSARKGPPVRIRCQREPNVSIEQMDGQIRRSPYTTKEHQPAQYFDAQHDAARHAKLVARLVKRLQQEFPTDILHFQPGPDLVTGADATTVDVPTLTVKQTTYFTGATTLNKPRGVFVSITVAFDAVFAIPGEKKPLISKFRKAGAPDLRTIMDEKLSPEVVYTRMTDKCYDGVAQSWLATLLKQP
jgi:hypothetical protein